LRPKVAHSTHRERSALVSFARLPALVNMTRQDSSQYLACGQVSTPGAWDEIDEIHPDQFTLASLPSRLERIGDPWLAMNEAPQSLEPFLAMNVTWPPA